MALKIKKLGKICLLMISRNLRWLVILLKSFFQKNKKYKVLNFEMFLNPRGAGLDLKENSIHKQLALDGIRENQATRIMQKFISPNDVVLELGANIGYYVLIEAKIIKNGFIYAVEPSPENVNLLKKNVVLNNLRNIEICDIAIADKTRRAELFLSKASNFHSLIKHKKSQHSQKSIMVRTETVDYFLKKRKQITFLRMDIEGYETEVIKSMEKTFLSPKFRKIFVEIHPHNVSAKKMRSFLEKMKTHGFKLEHAISHDNFQRKILGQTRVEKLSLEQLMGDKRVVNKDGAFELFLQR